MTRKIYRTAQGKQVDLGALQLQNENVRAVGNMGVNARGDLINSANQPIESKNRTVKKTYDRQVTNVSNQPVTKPSDTSRPSMALETVKMPVTEPVTIQTSEVAALDSAAEPQNAGLAAAIAKARMIRTQPLLNQKDLVKTKPGTSKI